MTRSPAHAVRPEAWQNLEPFLKITHSAALFKHAEATTIKEENDGSRSCAPAEI
jgi:hypothetical protein